MVGSASACSFTQWGQGAPAGGPTVGTVGTTLIAGSPPTVARYAGLCAAQSTAAGNYVQDGSPSAETNYRVRFYVFTGLSAGTATVFQALRTSDSLPAIAVDYDATAGNFVFKTANGANSVNVGSIAQSKWYAIELNWANGGNMAINVQGNAASTTTAATVAAGSGNIDVAQLGWIAGAGTPIAGKAIITDAFESRRATAIGVLCRGDGNGDTNRNSGDLIAIRNDFLGLGLATGQPDCNQDGAVNSGDLICVRNIFLAGTGACTNAL